MEKVIAYKAADGTIFVDPVECRTHEAVVLTRKLLPGLTPGEPYPDGERMIEAILKNSAVLGRALVAISAPLDSEPPCAAPSPTPLARNP